jgi:heavy metal sensor kinase
VTNSRTHSIRFRLTASYTAVLALTFALIGVSIWIALDHSIQATADRDLRARLADVTRYVDTFSPNDLLHLEAEFREESLLSQAIANIRICDPSGHWLFRTPSADRWPLPLLGSTHSETIRIGHDHVRLLTAPIKVGTVQIGLNIGELEEVKNGFLWTMSLGSPLLMLVAALGGYWMSGRALRPVDEISLAAAQISAQDLSARLPSRGVGDELDRLSNVLNEMLRRLEAAFHRITEFTADASHELRTPVAVIQTTAELMQTRPRTVAEHVAAWANVYAETERTTLLIGDLLLLARSDAGKNDLELCPIDLAETASQAVAEMHVMADVKGLNLTIDGSNQCPIIGDADALRRAICILLDNAIKFTPAPGDVRISVANGTQAIVKVSDTGPGIAPEDIPLIFERFYRAAKDRNRKTGGAGLGLSIAHWIVARHGGQIQVESAVGQGSVFSMVLPCEASSPSSTHSSRPAVPHSEPRP